MRWILRFRFLALALMLAVSHVALVSHVTAHFEPQWEDCELCVSEAQPLAAIPAAEHGVLPESEDRVSEFARPALLKPAVACHSHHQRDPPVPSS
jgi:hypothetical protein